MHGRADNRKSCILNDETGLSCTHATLLHHGKCDVMLMTLRHFHDAIFFFQRGNNYINFFFAFLNANALNKRFGRCDKQIITWTFGHRP